MNVTTCPGVTVIRVVRAPVVVILAPYLVQIFESNDVAVLGGKLRPCSLVPWYEPLPPSTICGPKWQEADISDMLFVLYQNLTA